MRRKGSPPRGRGKDDDLVLMMADLRITPAWAGKRAHLHKHVLTVWDHPRVGGEKRFKRDQNILTTGSPPRGRGKVS